MNKFEIEIVNYFNAEEPVAEVYYSNVQWAKIFCKKRDLIVHFYPPPKEGCWEFPLQEALKTLNQAKNKLTQKLDTKSFFVTTEQIDPKKFNKKAQEILEKILNHPEKKVFYGELNRFGKIMDIYAPNLGGARYTVNNEFLGFLEL